MCGLRSRRGLGPPRTRVTGGACSVHRPNDRPAPPAAAAPSLTVGVPWSTEGNTAMAILPTKIQDLLDFCDLHGNVWEAAPAAAIGLTAAQVTAFKALAAAARDAYNDQQADIAKARASTVTANTAAGAVRQSAADLLKVIKA